ncbi:MAG: redoxin domain-containing protein [Candidatus Acidiferrales bacterium]
MKRSVFSLIAIAGALLIAPIIMSAIKIGEPAPDFSATASNGKTYKLAEFRGKYVVLEWHNNGCPYTRKHYESGNMQRLQREWTGKGVAWFTVISSAPGTQGYMTADQENAYLAKMGATPTAALLDPNGDLGHLYDAKTTPHMIIINPQGVVIYDGAIDDHVSSDASDIPNSKNYVSAALTEAFAGRPVSEPATRPYGCTVKYAGSSH